MDIRNRVTTSLMLKNHPLYSSKALLSRDSLLFLLEYIDASALDTLHSFGDRGDMLLAILLEHYLQNVARHGKNHIIVPGWLAPSVLQLIKRFEHLDLVIHYLPHHSTGMLDIEKFEKMITVRTGFVYLPWIFSITGVILPIEELLTFCQDREIHLHLDLSGSVGLLSFPWSDYEAGSLSFSTAGLGGLASSYSDPNLLFVRSQALAMVEKPYPAPAYFLGLKKGLEQCSRDFDRLHLRVASIRDALEQALLDRVSGCVAPFYGLDRLPQQMVLLFDDINGEALLYWLLCHDIDASIGEDPYWLSDLFIHIGFSAKEAFSAIMLTLPADITDEESQRIATLLVEGVDKLRSQAGLLTVESLTEATLLQTTITPRLLGWGEYAPLLARYAVELEPCAPLPSPPPYHANLSAVTKNSEGTVFCAVLLQVDERDHRVVDASFGSSGPPMLVGLCKAISIYIKEKKPSQDRLRQMSVMGLEDLIKEKTQKRSPWPAQGRSLAEMVLATVKIALGEETLTAPCDSLREEISDHEQRADWPLLSTQERKEAVRDLLEQEVQPYVAMDGGQVELVDFIEPNRVLIRYAGACATCYAATDSTLSNIIFLLRKKLDRSITVEPLFPEKRMEEMGFEPTIRV